MSDRFTFLLAFVGHPGFDPGTLGLKETCEVLLHVGLVSWCCRNMRPIQGR